VKYLNNISRSFLNTKSTAAVSSRVHGDLNCVQQVPLH